MDAQAFNGSLITALFMAWGLVANDPVLIAASLAMAGVSYLVNLGVDVLRWPTIGLGVLAYVYAAAKLVGAI